MRTDPEPHDAIVGPDPESPIVKANSDREDRSCFVDLFKLKTRMMRIVLPALVRPGGGLLNMQRELREQSAECLGRVRGHKFTREASFVPV